MLRANRAILEYDPVTIPVTESAVLLGVGAYLHPGKYVESMYVVSHSCLVEPGCVSWDTSRQVSFTDYPWYDYAPDSSAQRRHPASHAASPAPGLTHDMQCCGSNGCFRTA